MKDPRDRFSDQSEDYLRYRPAYPTDFINDLVCFSTARSSAWDCGTGNGQVAALLSRYFKQIEATDISAQQLNKAMPVPNVNYSQCRAEKTPFAPNSFDMITVGQAAHWFDLAEFYREVQRVSRNLGILALWGYGLLRIEPAINDLIDRFYNETVGLYWDPERKHVEQSYQHILFPFEEIFLDKSYKIEKTFYPESLARYIGTWSSVQKFRKDRNFDPLPGFIEELNFLWSDGKETKTADFPIFARIGKIYK